MLKVKDILTFSNLGNLGLLAMIVVMHKADSAYSIQITWSFSCLDLFFTLTNNTWILLSFSVFHWICLLVISPISMGVEVLLFQAVTLS